jgi:RNA polymerase sigma-70 factor (ECF subfamily)
MTAVLASVSHGDADAAAQLYAHRPFLLRIARLHLGDGDLAEDVVQETLIAALAGFATYAGNGTLKSWLVGIARHKIVDALRSRARRPINESDLSRELSLDDMNAYFDRGAAGVWELQPADWGDPVRSREEADFLRTVEWCLTRLPPNSARAFMLRELFGLSTREVCELLFITGNNLGVLLYRARMSLRACLELRWFSGDEGPAHDSM